MANNEQVQPASSSAPFVEGNVFTVRGLSFAYKQGREEKQIFKDFNLDLHEGAITTFIGANGCGKSTLFNLLTKNLKPQAGTIYLRGGNVEAMRLRDYAKLVAIVHQRNVAPPGLSVRKLVEYGRTPFHALGHSATTDEDEECVQWAMDVAGLNEIAEAPASRLSGGQMQRVWIGMALAQRPGVLLLDEPTTYLDIRYQLDVLHLVQRLNHEFGMTIVMVLHDMNQALGYSSEVVALADGQVVAQGAPADVITHDVIQRVYGIDLDIIDVDGLPFVLERTCSL